MFPNFGWFPSWIQSMNMINNHIKERKLNNSIQFGDSVILLLSSDKNNHDLLFSDLHTNSKIMSECYTKHESVVTCVNKIRKFYGLGEL